MKGIDIYEGDNIQDWNKVKAAGIEVVIQKATQGTMHIDSLLQYRYPRIKEADLKLGFYHFANNTGNPESQAQHFLDSISGLVSDTVLWLDIEAEESWSKQAAINFANAFVSYIQNKGFKIGIYTGDAFYHDYLEGNIPDVPLWLASYGKQPSLYPSSASWQYSETGSIDGIAGKVDLDYFIDNILLNVKKEELKVENLIVYGEGADMRAAQYLADHLVCPICCKDNLTIDTINATKNIYVVGGTWKPCAQAILISGSDRMGTIKAVLNFIDQ